MTQPFILIGPLYNSRQVSKHDFSFVDKFRKADVRVQGREWIGSDFWESSCHLKISIN